jgi:hypothetical protein
MAISSSTVLDCTYYFGQPRKNTRHGAPARFSLACEAIIQHWNYVSLNPQSDDHSTNSRSPDNCGSPWRRDKRSARLAFIHEVRVCSLSRSCLRSTRWLCAQECQALRLGTHNRCDASTIMRNGLRSIHRLHSQVPPPERQFQRSNITTHSHPFDILRDLCRC